MGFQKIIQNIRINHAAELLVETDYSLETISKMVGYSTVQNFREAFYRQLNISPKEYRKMTPKVAVD